MQNDHNKYKPLTVAEALAVLIDAHQKLGGDACLILSLTNSGIACADVNSMVIMDDPDDRYVEVRAFHCELAEE